MNSSDPWKTLVPNFLNEGATKVRGKNGAFRFAKKIRYLNKKTQIWFDEAQDLRKNSCRCYIKINAQLCC